MEFGVHCGLQTHILLGNSEGVVVPALLARALEKKDLHYLVFREKDAHVQLLSSQRWRFQDFANLTWERLLARFAQQILRAQADRVIHKSWTLLR